MFVERLSFLKMCKRDANLMIIVNDRPTAKRFIFIAFGVFFLFFWGVMIFAVRPRIESRLKATTEASLPKVAELSGVEVDFRGRDGVVSGVFTTEAERGRVQSLMGSLRVEGARRLETDFRLRELPKDSAVFSFAVKGREILAEGSVSSVTEKNALLNALKSVANGRAIIDELRVSDRTASAAWVTAASGFAPVLIGGSEGTSLRIDGGKLKIGGEALNAHCRKAIDESLPGLVRVGLKVENTMTLAAPLEDPRFQLRMEGDAVVLEGLLPAGGAREIVVNGAQRGAPAGKIEDRITVGEKVLPPLWIEGLGDLLASLLSEAERVEIEISPTGCRLAGHARNESSKGKIEGLARSVVGAAGLELNSVMTAPVPKEPASVALAFSEDGLKITGVVPSDEVRQQIRTAVRRGSGNVSLEEALEIGPNTATPAWIAALDVFVPHLLINARSGEFRIEHELIYVSARVLSNERQEGIEGALGSLAKASGLEVSEKQFLLIDPPAAETVKREDGAVNPEETSDELAPEPVIVGSPEIAANGEAKPMAGRPANLVPPLFLPDYAVFFGHGTAMLKAADEAQIKRMASAIIANAGTNLVVAGFSDSSGNRDFNEWLAERRAEEVRAVLVRGGVDGARLDLRVFAAVGPKGADKEDPRLREFRRVEILVERSSGQGVGSLSPLPVPTPEAPDLGREPDGGDENASVATESVEVASLAPEMMAPVEPEIAPADLPKDPVPDVEEGISDEVMDTLFATDESAPLDSSVAVEIADIPEPELDLALEAKGAEGAAAEVDSSEPDGSDQGAASGEVVSTEEPEQPDVVPVVSVAIAEPDAVATESESPVSEVAPGAPVPAEAPAPVSEPEAPTTMETSETPTETVIEGEISGTIYFAHGTAMLTSEDRKELRKIASQLKEKGDAKFLIAGFADRTGNPDFNQWLSEERAKNVRAILSDGGIRSSRVTVEVFGASAATGDPDSEEIQRMNRRVEVRILP
jgi:outer membrane protein OmpA-like peptidoglycan-associated protein